MMSAFSRTSSSRISSDPPAAGSTGADRRRAVLWPSRLASSSLLPMARKARRPVMRSISITASSNRPDEDVSGRLRRYLAAWCPAPSPSASAVCPSWVSNESTIGGLDPLLAIVIGQSW